MTTPPPRCAAAVRAVLVGRQVPMHAPGVCAPVEQLAGVTTYPLRFQVVPFHLHSFHAGLPQGGGGDGRAAAVR